MVSNPDLWKENTIIKGALSRSPVLLPVTVREQVARAYRVPLRVVHACTRTSCLKISFSSSVCKNIFLVVDIAFLPKSTFFWWRLSLSLSPSCSWRGQGEWPRSWWCHALSPPVSSCVPSSLWIFDRDMPSQTYTKKSQKITRRVDVT